MEGSGLSEFAGQIAGLIAVTFVAGAVWVTLTVVIFQRARERRRRTSEGLPPLPSFYRQAWDYLRGEETPPPAEPPVEPPAARSSTNVPSPNLSDLTSDLPAPDLSALTGAFDDEEVIAMPPPPVQAESVPQPRIAVEPAPAVVPAEALTDLPEDSIEMLRVWRDVNDGGLIIDMKGQYFRHVSEITDDALVRRFQTVMDALNQMNQKPSVSLMPRQPLNTSEETDEPQPVAVGGIADQIEQMLQARLASSGAFPGRSIHVLPTEDGGVRIEIDDTAYESVGDVAETDIREFIQQTIQEWEANHP